MITLLGTGATMPLPDRALTAVALVYGGRTILFYLWFRLC